MKLILENWRKYLSESSEDGSISVNDVHNRANDLKIVWDNNAQFMKRTKEITGKSHLDDMTSDELSKVYAALERWKTISKTTQIFCDMDGVLVDFESTAISLTNNLLAGGQLPGVSRSKGHFYRVQQVHDEMGKDWRLQSGSDLQIQVVRRLMLTSISSNPGLIFSSMQPHQDGISQLWPFLNKAGLIVNILSAPINGNKSSPTTAADGKTEWVQTWLTPQPTNIIITPSARKFEHATTNGTVNILIDDKASTINAWNEAGGIGILHIPKNSEKSIQQLTDILNKNV